MPQKISKNQRVEMQAPVRRGKAYTYENPPCGACGALSRRLRARYRVCENGHRFLWKEGQGKKHWRAIREKRWARKTTS